MFLNGTRTSPPCSLSLNLGTSPGSTHTSQDHPSKSGSFPLAHPSWECQQLLQLTRPACRLLTCGDQILVGSQILRMPQPRSRPSLTRACALLRPGSYLWDHLTAVVEGVKSQLEEKENKKFPVFKAVKFRSQVVAGMNYLIKVQVDEDDFVHIRVFESLPHENKPVALTSYQTNKSRHDELTYF
uniref:Cystatin domain-containing protein n=1 Tax=Bos indicus x Bos taurus TaxID=30522 RepID=A0A4W2F1R0_BOBOX